MTQPPSIRARDYIRNELSRYINVRSAQIENRIDDRIIECEAKDLNPLDWVYCENTERVNYKTATYFRWEKKS